MRSGALWRDLPERYGPYTTCYNRFRPLTPGQAHDANGGVVLGDKTYDADWIGGRIQVQGAAPNIPDKVNRRGRHCFSKTLYKERNRVERFFNRIKHFRRVATRFEKFASNYLAMVKLASIWVWLRIQETTHVAKAKVRFLSKSSRDLIGT